MERFEFPLGQRNRQIELSKPLIKFLTQKVKKNKYGSENSTRYCTIGIRRKGEASKKHFSVHRLVAEMFVEGKTPERCNVDHIDGNGENNHHSNLRWCTATENINFSVKAGTHKPKGETNLKLLKTMNENNIKVTRDRWEAKVGVNYGGGTLLEMYFHEDNSIHYGVKKCNNCSKTAKLTKGSLHQFLAVKSPRLKYCKSCVARKLVTNKI